MTQYYTSGMICEMFGMSKMTLVRLEQRGIITPPPQRLKRNGQRLYTKEHVAQIKAYWLATKEDKSESAA
jgi:DNA-binding transcriptional MerR regulator